MRFAVLGPGEESDRIAGWLADEGQVVRRLADTPALAAFDAGERFDWVICDVSLGRACRDALQQRGSVETPCLLIADAADDIGDPATLVLRRPLRRRLLLSTVRDGAPAQVRGTK